MNRCTESSLLRAYCGAPLLALILAALQPVAVSAPAAPAAFSVPIRWDVGVTAGVPPHAVLALPVDILGRTCHVQVDTGANSQLRLDDGASGATRRVTLSLGALALDTAATDAFAARLGRSDECGVIGVVGNALFESGTIAIDLDHARFLFMPGSRLRTTQGQPMRYVRPPGWEGGYVVLPLAIGGVAYQAAFDTGAASFGFVPFDAALWKRLRGQAGAPASFQTAVVKTSVDHSRCTRSTAGLAATVGNEAVMLPLGFCEYQPALPIPGLDGMLGLAPFRVGVIVIDYVGQRWLHSAHLPDTWLN